MFVELIERMTKAARQWEREKRAEGKTVAVRLSDDGAVLSIKLEDGTTYYNSDMHATAALLEGAASAPPAKPKKGVKDTE